MKPKVLKVLLPAMPLKLTQLIESSWILYQDLLFGVGFDERVGWYAMRRERDLSFIYVQSPESARLIDVDGSYLYL